MIRSPRVEHVADVLLGVARSARPRRASAAPVGGRAAVQRAGERADRGRQRRGAVGAGRGDDARGEGRGVEAVLGGPDPVGVDRLRRAAVVGLAAPADQELRRRVLALARRRRTRARAAVGDARRLRDDRDHRRREPRRDRRAPARPVMSMSCRAPTSARESRAPAWRSAITDAARVLQLDTLGLRHPRLEALVDEQAPDLLERVVADELLDVDAAIAERRRLPGRARRSPSRRRRRPRARAEVVHRPQPISGPRNPRLPMDAIA